VDQSKWGNGDSPGPSSHYEGPSSHYASSGNETDGTKETLHGSSLFGCLPWSTPDLAHHFKEPEGMAKVGLLFLSL
jgi:hypothetical protein